MSQSAASGGLQFVVTNTLIVRDIQRSVAFYRDVLGATMLREGEPTFLRFGNIWLIINVGGGPTDDKPEVLAAPPPDPNILSIFLNLRVTDIRRYYDLWSSRGAKFITSPRSTRGNCGVTCATRMDTLLKSDKRRRPRVPWTCTCNTGPPPNAMSAFGPKRTFHMSHLMSLPGVKRTCLVALHMSAFDPKRNAEQQCRLLVLSALTRRVVQER